MRQISKGFVAVALIALMAAGCSNSADTNTNNTTTEMPVVNTNTDTPAVTDGTTKTFNVDGIDFKFNPSEIRVNEGDTVVINFTNPDVMPHDWVVDELDGARTKILNKDQKETISFVASKKGTFEYYCSVGQHRERGMVGNLIVE
jgi:plastocyanin